MKKHWKNAILFVALTLIVFSPVSGLPAASGEQHSGAGKPKSTPVIDLTGPVKPSSAAASIPGFSLGGVPGEKPVDNSLPVRLTVESLETKAGKRVVRIRLLNQSEYPLDIPISLSPAASPEAQEGSTSFLFSLTLSVPGSNQSLSRPLVSSSDSDPKHSKVVLPVGEEAVILLPLLPHIFRAKDVKDAPELVARVSLSELKIKKQEYKTESVRRTQSVNSLTLSAKQISELAKGNNQ